MPDLQELEPINASPEVEDSVAQPLQKEKIPSLELIHLLDYLEEKLKIVLLFILLSVTASFFILNEHPSPSSSPQQTISQMTTNNPPSSLPDTFSSLEDDPKLNTAPSQIPKLSSQIRTTLDQLLTQTSPTISDLKMIKQNLEASKKKIGEKIQHHQKRSNFFNEKSKFEYFGALKLQKYNGPLQKGSFQENRVKDQASEYNDMNYNYHFDKLKAEIPICIIAYALKTKKLYASDYFLTSIQNQKYSNYKVIVVLEDPEEATQMMWKTSIYYLNFSKVELIVHKEKVGYWESIKSAINNLCCNKAEVITLMNGNDELLGFNVLTSLNAAYQLNQANVVYSNFIEYHPDSRQLFRGFSKRYTSQERVNNKYRELALGFGQIISFRKHLFSYISDESVQISSEYSTQFATNIALYFCLLQLSCGAVEYIPQYYYLMEGYTFIGNSQEIVDNYLNKLKGIEPYKCFKYYQKGK